MPYLLNQSINRQRSSVSTMGEMDNDEDEDDDDTGASEADFDQVCSPKQLFYDHYISCMPRQIF